jgi:diguanylate cyclase (GGDEF)-like protein
VTQKSPRRDEGQGAARSAETQAAVEPDPSPRAHESGFDVAASADATAYDWDLKSDRLAWEGPAEHVFGGAGLAEIATGAAFEDRIALEHVQRRRNTVAPAEGSADGRGAPYRVCYRFHPGGPRDAIWIEEHGRWWPGDDGRPVRARGVLRVVADSYVQEQRDLYRSDRDELTGQLDRPSFTSALQTVLSRRRPAALLVACVNNLAVVNETFGFDVGDEVIAAAVHIMRSRLRSADTLGRYSANKFGIILDGCSGAVAMRAAAERFIAAAREKTVATRACPVAATISIGGILLPEQAAGAEAALSRALQALERARHKRFDCFVSYEPSAASVRARRRNIAIADEIVAALREDRMRLVLQPIVSARTRLPALHEVLVRLHRADGTTVPAGDFMVVAEQLGLSRLIDRRTLELAVALLEQRPQLRLALNVSALTASDHDWLLALQKLTGCRRSLTERLTIEITETAASEDLDQTIAFVDNLKELGCRVAIDDFGAGYTSFKNLKLLDVDMVKIDGTFVQNLRRDPSDRVFIRTMAELAQSFGLETVAEWVGDDETAAILARAGITYLQGYHFGRPMPASQLEVGLGGLSSG